MIISTHNTDWSNTVLAHSSEKLYDRDRNFLATVEVDHVRNSKGEFGCYIRLQDIGYRDIDHNTAESVGLRLHQKWERDLLMQQGFSWSEADQMAGA